LYVVVRVAFDLAAAVEPSVVLWSTEIPSASRGNLSAIIGATPHILWPRCALKYKSVAAHTMVISSQREKGESSLMFLGNPKERRDEIQFIVTEISCGNWEIVKD
jgi:hypothetical protein